jgi:hypothetical protein
MFPEAIVNDAINKELDMIAICDHNSAENVEAVMIASRDTKLVVLAGMEITSQEEVHIIGLFRCLQDAINVQIHVYNNLIGENIEEIFGKQVIVDFKGNVLGFNHNLLIGATELTLDQVINTIHKNNGLAIAAHIDREGFGIIGQLGLIPPNLSIDGLEISSKISFSHAKIIFSQYSGFNFLQSSDAHKLADIGIGKTTIRSQSASFEELKLALQNKEGREIIYKE